MFLLTNSRALKNLWKILKRLKNFKNSKNQLFDAVIYGIMYYRCGSEQIVQEKIIGYFDRCFKLNEVLVKHNYFMFFERRDTCRFLIKKKVQGKNEVIRNLLSSVLEKFNGYEMIRNHLHSEEGAELIQINVVCKPIYDEAVPVPCFTNEIHLACRSYIGTLNKENE